MRYDQKKVHFPKKFEIVKTFQQNVSNINIGGDGDGNSGGCDVGYNGNVVGGSSCGDCGDGVGSVGSGGNCAGGGDVACGDDGGDGGGSDGDGSDGDGGDGSCDGCMGGSGGSGDEGGNILFFCHFSAKFCSNSTILDTFPQPRR